MSTQSFPNEPDTSEFAVIGTDSPTPETGNAGDEADLADALIAEAREIADAEPVDSEHVLVSATDAEKEAHELAELVAPDVGMTESEIPESFEFTLTTAPEALAEQAPVEAADDLESFDFQLSDASGAEQDHTTMANDIDKSNLADDDSAFNTLLLDEDEGDFEASAPLNECDTKLDLAVAYEAMGDIEGAIEILDEVVADGDDAQIAEANRLKGLWQNS
jgi:pilus assembly protein FimV